MLQSAELLIDVGLARRFRLEKPARLLHSVIDLPRKLVAPIAGRMERSRRRAEIAAMDAHLRNDVGLGPLDTFYGWRGSPWRDD